MVLNTFNEGHVCYAAAKQVLALIDDVPISRPPGFRQQSQLAGDLSGCGAISARRKAMNR